MLNPISGVHGMNMNDKVHPRLVFEDDNSSLVYSLFRDQLLVFPASTLKHLKERGCRWGAGVARTIRTWMSSRSSHHTPGEGEELGGDLELAVSLIDITKVFKRMQVLVKAAPGKFPTENQFPDHDRCIVQTYRWQW
jgi:hypothetical protein